MTTRTRRRQMADVTFREIDRMDAIHGGLARRARAELGVSAWGMQVFTLPPDWDGYPEHTHGADAFDPNQEEVYVPLEGSAVLVADGTQFERLRRLPGALPAARSPAAPRRAVASRA
jgi:hypothetical protein